MEQSPEEARVDFTWPQRILEASGFKEYNEDFASDLEDVTDDRPAAWKVIERHARRLWNESVAIAQGRGPPCDLHRYDDRPIYWARLEMSRTLRQYDPEFNLSQETHSEMLRRFDRLSRGYESVNIPEGEGVTAVKVSGFDPFSHIFVDGEDIANRDNNPSGAAMLAMDGRLFETDEGPVLVDTLMLPVGWQRLNDEILEDAFGPRIESGEVDMIMTVSRGGYAVQDIEAWAGARRGGGIGTNLVRPYQYIPPAEGWPMPTVDDVENPIAPQTEQLEWIPTTLPFEEMMATDEGFTDEEPPWPVIFDEGSTGWPAPDDWEPGDDDPRFPPVVFEHELVDFGETHETLPEGYSLEENLPPEGMLAFNHPGGDYMSNESQYRSNRLRIGLGEHDMGGGHLHVSGASFAEDNEDEVTDDRFETELEGTVDQIIDLLLTATVAKAMS